VIYIKIGAAFGAIVIGRSKSSWTGPAVPGAREMVGYVAIVDDDEGARDALAALLRAYGMETRTYSSPGDFLAALPSGLPSCMVVDIHMPVMTGLDLRRELLRLGVRVPTIIITGRDQRSYREDCRDLGVAAYLLKPLDADALIGAISSAVGPN
jgi:FixJ family two-component response regulator